MLIHKEIYIESRQDVVDFRIENILDLCKINKYINKYI